MDASKTSYEPPYGLYLFNTLALLVSAALFMVATISRVVLGSAVEWSVLALMLSLSNLLVTRKESIQVIITGIALISSYTLHLYFNSVLTMYLTLLAAMTIAIEYTVFIGWRVRKLALPVAIILYTYLSVTHKTGITSFNIAYIILAILVSIPSIEVTGRLHSIASGIVATLILFVSPSSHVSGLVLIGLLLFLLHTTRSGSSCPFRREPFLFISGLVLQAITILVLLIEHQPIYTSILYWILGYLLSISGLTSPPFYSMQHHERKEAYRTAF